MSTKAAPLNVVQRHANCLNRFRISAFAFSAPVEAQNLFIFNLDQSRIWHLKSRESMAWKGYVSVANTQQRKIQHSSI